MPEPLVGGFKGETWRTSHAKCGAGSWPESNHAGPQALFAARTQFPDPREPEPFSLGKPPALASLYQFRQLHFSLHSPLCVLRKDAQFGCSPARPRLQQRRGPALQPMSAHKDPPRGGAGELHEGRGRPTPRPQRRARPQRFRPPLPRAGGWAAPERLRCRELQLPAGIAAPCRTTDHLQLFYFPSLLGGGLGFFGGFSFYF